MKTKNILVASRRKSVLKEVQAKIEVSVDDLAEQFQVSPLTIRRDLQYWEDKGLVHRFYGGAKIIQHLESKDPTKSNEPYKHAIAKYAAQYVENGDTIFINTSSTALLVLKYIRGKRVTVITNNGKAIFMEHDPLVSIVLSGGELRIPKESMVGDFALTNLHRVTANKCFLGCSGFDIHTGMSTAVLHEVSINEMMINQCKGEIFLLADSTKIGTIHQFIIADASAFQYVITDNRVNKNILEEFHEYGLNAVGLPPFYNYDEKDKS